MDIGLLYQEYRRFATTQNSVSQQQLQRQRQQQQQGGSSTGEDILLRSIRQAMPNLLAHCSPGSSRLSASLPLSASSEDEEEEDGEDFLPQPPQPPRPKQRHPPAASACRKALSEPVQPSVAFESATAATVAAAASPTIADKQQQKQRQLHRQTASAADAGCKEGKNSPLLVIDPKDVKSMLTQIVKATMRDLLGKDQETREKCLLRQIKRTLGEFEASMSAIVQSFAISRCQAPAISQRTVRNNSAGVPDSFAVCDVGSGSGGFGAGVCIGAASGSCSKEETQVGSVGAGAASSRDSGQTIGDSCCHSDDRATGSTRVGVRESDSVCGDMLPPRYRHLSSLCCPHCTTVSGSSGYRNRHQKNFNHASSSSSFGSNAGSDFCVSDCEETLGQSGEEKEEFEGILPPASDTATAYTERTSRLPFPRFTSDARGHPEQQATPTPPRRHHRSCRSAYFFCTDEEDEGDGEENEDEDSLP